jgi:hypothetical protein
MVDMSAGCTESGVTNVVDAEARRVPRQPTVRVEHIVPDHWSFAGARRAVGSEKSADVQKLVAVAREKMASDLPAVRAPS